MRTLIVRAALLAMIATPVLAQQPPAVEKRVDRLEREMRAVQRKVFPGGSQQYVEPEIGPPPPAAGGVPASSAVADLATRVGSLEQELTRLTGQVEQNSFKLRQLEDQLNRLSAATMPPPAPAATPAAPETAPAPAFVPLKPPAPSAPAEPAASSGDPGEDAYLAGYKLWTEKKYPQAVAALRDVVAKYPKHRRASYAQNLLGRALLDDGQPAKAAEAFYASYQKMPRGDRAADSLYYLGQALMALKPPKPADACKVYAELTDVYGEKISQPLKDRVAKGRADAKCV